MQRSHSNLHNNRFGHCRVVLRRSVLVQRILRTLVGLGDSQTLWAMGRGLSLYIEVLCWPILSLGLLGRLRQLLGVSCFCWPVGLLFLSLCLTVLGS